MSAFPTSVWVYNPGGSKEERKAYYFCGEHTYNRSTDQTNERQCKHFLSEKVEEVRLDSAVSAQLTADILYYILENGECMALLTIY